MVVIKYYCDCCKKEVNSKEDLKMITIFSEFKAMQDDEYPYEPKDICKECYTEIKGAINSKYKEIENKNKIKK